MKNTVLLSGIANNVTLREYDKTAFLSFNVRVNSGRVRDDGTPISHSFTVRLSGPMATKIKEKLSNGNMVCVEGRFEPRQDKESKTWYYPVNATSIEVLDAGHFNHLVLSGRLTQNVEVKNTANSKVIRTNIATSRHYQDKSSNEWKEVNSFVTIVAWGDVADALASYKKGELVWITGSLVTRKWTNDKGENFYPVEVNAESVRSGGSGKYNVTVNTDSQNTKSSSKNVSEEEFMDIDDADDLPFD